VTPLGAKTWEDALAKHQDKEFCYYIIRGIQQDFHIGFNGTMCRAMRAGQSGTCGQEWSILDQ